MKPKLAVTLHKEMHEFADGAGTLLVDAFHYLALFAIGGTIVWSAVAAFLSMTVKGLASIDDILLLFIYLELGAMVGIYFKTTPQARGGPALRDRRDPHPRAVHPGHPLRLLALPVRPDRGNLQAHARQARHLGRIFDAPPHGVRWALRAFRDRPAALAWREAQAAEALEDHLSR